MNAKELRIGNLVFNDKCLNTIENLLSDGVCTLKTKQGNFIHARYELIEPITLTEEWFIDHGFPKDKDGVINIGKSLYWLPSGYWGNTGVVQIAFGYSPLINCPCEFVHQLQNIYFAFYGKEINIELL